MPISELLKKKAETAAKEMAEKKCDKLEIPGFENIFLFSDIADAAGSEMIGTVTIEGKYFWIAKKF